MNASILWTSERADYGQGCINTWIETADDVNSEEHGTQYRTLDTLKQDSSHYYKQKSLTV